MAKVKSLKVSVRPDARDAIEALKRRLSEAAEIRRREADWSFIMSQPPRIAKALMHLIETGDLLASARIAGMNPIEFDYLREKARIMYDI